MWKAPIGLNATMRQAKRRYNFFEWIALPSVATVIECLEWALIWLLFFWLESWLCTATC